jgi:hypothetical protein
MGTMKKLLWLDDVRNPMENDWLVFSPIGKNVDVTWVKSYSEFTSWITCNGLPDAICFDHDLGKELESKLLKKGASKRLARQLKAEEKSGYDAAKWLVDYCMDNELNLPEWGIQSANPVGRESIDGLLKGFKKHVTFVQNG